MVEQKTVVTYHLVKKEIPRELLKEEVEAKEVIHTKCPNCKCWRPPQGYLSETGRKLKTCEKCRAKAKRSRERRKAKQKEEQKEKERGEAIRRFFYEKEEQKINYDSDEAEKKFMIKLAQRRLNNLYRKA